MRETRTVEKIFQYWHRQRSTFSCAFWFFSCVRTEGQTKLEKERKKKQQERERDNERERKRERKNEENESVLQPKTQPQQHHFLQRKKNTENFVSQHIMASPEAAAILRELQGKNGNGVRF